MLPAGQVVLKIGLACCCNATSWAKELHSNMYCQVTLITHVECTLQVVYFTSGVIYKWCTL